MNRQHAYMFIDRDGVINRDSSDYIKSLDDFQFLPGSVDALVRLTRAGVGLVVITNQSIIGRGWVPAKTVDGIHRHLTTTVAEAGGRIEAIYHCPHAPADHCDCRKPKPTLIQRACRDLGIDPARAAMVGDKASDIRCGQGAGTAATILVRSVHSRQAIFDLTAAGQTPDAVTDDLAGAAQWWLTRLRRNGFA